MRIKSFDDDSKGILYLVATPIGNLKDITFRALEILKEVDKIYAEDTRTSKTLLSYYNIETKLESYHEFNQELKEDKIITEIENGMHIALISDAGLPVISDPGYKIASALIKKGLRVSTIPGPSAGISALIKSGIAPMPYLFYGFLDAKEAKKKEELNELKYEKSTLVFYEAPHRINKTLEAMLEVLGNRFISIEREITKLHEEHIDGYIKDLIDLEYKGEIVIIVEGYKEDKIKDINYIEQIDNLINKGYKLSLAVKEISNMYNLNRNELYKKYLDNKEDN